MNIYEDDRIVMTLDAGGTNFVFSAMQRGAEIVESITYPSNAHDLDLCLKTLIRGFEEVRTKLTIQPVAISFAFPGPADYKRGIIGKLPNLPAFNQAEAVALGPMLEDYFHLPTFIANDGNLFAYAEATAGALPYINEKLKQSESHKTYSNLIGITLGTGFGCGLVVNNILCEGDNSAGGEIWLTRNYKHPSMFVEATVSIKAMQQCYARLSNTKNTDLSPKDMYEIATGQAPGNQEAADATFDELAVVVAESLCNAVTLVDGLIVIGGGVAGAYSILAPKIIAHMNGTINNLDSQPIPRLVSEVFDLDDEKSFNKFIHYTDKEISVPFSDRKVFYKREKRIGICKSKLGTTKAISLGAYALALQKLSDPVVTRKDLIIL